MKAGDLVLYRRKRSLGRADTLACVQYCYLDGRVFAAAICTQENPYLAILVPGRNLVFVSTKGRWYVHRWYRAYRSARRGSP